ncbi:MAG: bifunctional 2-C-methyl-D-erythritol 4-phosphate cytidylyltransferase/2-C-methyl-D-erythritol 2,4-cyclodiphosphate synthase, partial [Novosphingobium sp. 16-62-11]
MNASQSLGQTQIAAIVVAAGKGLRTGGVLPKQFVIWRGKPLLRHSVEALLEAGIDPVVVAIPDGWEAVAADALAGLSPVRFVVGGATRQESVRVALEALEADAPAKVLIHDAARPVLPRAVINGLLGALDGALGAVPVLPVVD